MNIAKVKKNINNLKKIREIIEVSKFDTIQKLQTANKVTDTFMKMAIKSKNIIEFSSNKYWTRSPLLKPSKSKKTIWIFGTISTSLLGTSYSQQERMILSEFNREKHSLIVVGEPAIKFAEDSGIEPIYQEEDIDVALVQVPQLITSLTMGDIIPNVKFVSHNSYVPDEPITIFPITKLNIMVGVEKFDKKVKFYPSLASSNEYLGSLYSERLTEVLLRDAKYYYLKKKLIRHEVSLKSVDKKIEEKTRQMNKLIRKIETEELIHVSQIAKRGAEHE